MIKIGTYHFLEVHRIKSPGAFLTDGKENILLPKKFLTPSLSIGDKINVFVYRDSEDRIVSTTQTPFAEVNQFAYLKVKATDKIGAFLDWGLDKDLLLPFGEQKAKLRAGQWILIYIFHDQKTDRLAATAKVAKYFNSNPQVDEGEEVELLITNRTELGVNVVVDNKYKGLIFSNQLFHDVLEGDRVKGYVRNVRSDGKLDITLQKRGLANLEEGSQIILRELKLADGKLPIHDKCSPEEIQTMLQMSKKNYKRSVGMLLRKKMIKLIPGGIELIRD
ncbi:MAG: S1-like domain-containing RNA-binding protein [Bacteroidota bacterium]